MSSEQQTDTDDLTLSVAGRSRVGTVICLAGLALAIALLVLGFFGDVWIGFDVLSHLRLHFFIAILALLAVYISAVPYRVWVGVAMMLLGVMAIGNWHRFGADTFPAQIEAEPGTRALKVMHLNLWYWNDDLDAVQAEIKRLDPDVLFLAEFDAGKYGLTDRLKSEYPYMFPTKPTYRLELVMFSKTPFTEIEQKGPWRGSDYLRGRLGPEWGNVHIAGTHTSRPPYLRAQQRQISFTAPLIGRLEGPVIAMGDLNSTPYSAMLKSFQKITKLRRVTNLPSWPANGPRLPQLAIDHIFVSDGLKLLHPAITGRFVGSDHLPIATIVQVPVKP